MRPATSAARVQRVVALRGVVAAAVAAQVHRDRAEAGVGERGELVAPGPPEGREAVQQDHRGPSPASTRWKRQRVGGDVAVGPAALGPDDLVGLGQHGHGRGLRAGRSGLRDRVALSFSIDAGLRSGAWSSRAASCRPGRGSSATMMRTQRDDAEAGPVRQPGLHEDQGRGEQQEDQAEEGGDAGADEQPGALARGARAVAQLGLGQLDLAADQRREVLGDARDERAQALLVAHDVLLAALGWDATSRLSASRLRRRPSAPFRRGLALVDVRDSVPVGVGLLLRGDGGVRLAARRRARRRRSRRRSRTPCRMPILAAVCAGRVVLEGQLGDEQGHGEADAGEDADRQDVGPAQVGSARRG